MFSNLLELQVNKKISKNTGAPVCLCAALR